MIAEARRLAGLAEVDWKYQVGHGSAERLGIEPKELQQYVKAGNQRPQESGTGVGACADKQRQAAEDAEEKERKDEERKRVAAESAKRAEQKKRDDERKEAARKAKEKQKTFANIPRLPVARHEKELARLAKRLGEDVAALREEFAEFLGVGSEPAETTEPWPEPVNIAVVLQELGDKISRYVVMQKHQLIAAQLWTAHTWLYDYQVPVHSPILAATSAEPNSGKSTLVAVVGRASPRFSLNIEPTGPTLYRYVDATKPTIAIEEADDLFTRKSDLKHIINAGWTRGPKIQRQVNIGGVLHTVEFDPFTPKAIDLLGHNLPPTTRTRCIELRMRPKLKTEKVEQFNQLDDAEFAVLRRKLARFAADNAAALKDAKPILPSDLINRDAANWWLLLAIAELAGGGPYFDFCSVSNSVSQSIGPTAFCPFILLGRGINNATNCMGITANFHSARVPLRQHSLCPFSTPAVFPFQIKLQHLLQVLIKIRFVMSRSETRLLYSTKSLDMIVDDICLREWVRSLGRLLWSFSPFQSLLHFSACPLQIFSPEATFAPSKYNLFETAACGVL